MIWNIFYVASSDFLQVDRGTAYVIREFEQKIEAEAMHMLETL